MEESHSQICKWISAIKLKINSGQTEIIVFGTNQKLEFVDIPSLSVAGTKVIIIDSPTRNLGAMYNCSLSMKAQLKNIFKAANSQLRNIGTALKHLTEQTTRRLVSGTHSSVIHQL